MQRGTTLELNLTGTNLAGPTKLWTSFPAKVTIPTDKNNGKDNSKLRVRLQVAKDAPLGYHTIRLATTRGLSNFRLFCIDDLPQVMAVDTNRSKKTPQALTFPCVVVGRATQEASDYYKITVKAGQRVSFEVLGRRLGSAFDPQITLYNTRTGNELPDGHSNDAPGCQTDPRLTYTFKIAGTYLIEVRDVMYNGGPDFWYRLRVGDFPCATTPIPMAARRGTKVKVHFAGPTVDGVAPVEVAVPKDSTVNTVWVAPKGKSGLYGWPVALAVSDHDEVVEKEPNNEAAKANRIPVPGGITGRFETKGDVDYFVFAAKKGQRHIVEAHTHELYSPTEVYMVLKDPKGNQVAVTNPQVAPRLDFTAAADGDYSLKVEHLLYWGGPTESYRVTVTPFEPSFSLSVGLDRYDVPQGGTSSITVMAARNGYTGPIELSVVGTTGLTGQATIKAGQPAAPTLPAAVLVLHAKADLAMGAYPIYVQGKATINGKAVTRYASVRKLVALSMAGLRYPPRHLFNQVGVAVTEKPPFTLTAKFDHAEAARGVPATVTISATRARGFVEEIALSASPLPPNVVPGLKSIPRNQSEVKIQLTSKANARLGPFAVSFTGKARYQNREIVATSVPTTLTLVLPFALKIEPAPLKLAQGGKAKVKISAVRKGGYAGPITLQLRNLPANVVGTQVTIAAGKDAGEIEVTAGPTAQAGDKTGVNVLGTATAAGNQQIASANFTVTVVKK
jgi:hypothetical protein